jgi:hypothetical protein
MTIGTAAKTLISLALSVSILAACSGPPARPTGLPITPDRIPVRASYSSLLYVATNTERGTQMLTYPGGKPVGALSPAGALGSPCVDVSNGNIFS